MVQGRLGCSGVALGVRGVAWGGGGEGGEKSGLLWKGSGCYFAEHVGKSKERVRKAPKKTKMSQKNS